MTRVLVRATGLTAALLVSSACGGDDATATTTTTTAPPTTTTTEPEPAVHVVQAGDTLGAIASRYGTTVAELVELNALDDPDRLSIGQELRLPPQAP